MESYRPPAVVGVATSPGSRFLGGAGGPSDGGDSGLRDLRRASKGLPSRRAVDSQVCQAKRRNELAPPHLPPFVACRDGT